MKIQPRKFLLSAVCAAWLGSAFAAPDARIAALATKEKPALLETLKELVSIESGSRDLEGLEKISDLIAAKFKAMGGEVELIDPSAEAYRMGGHAREDRPGRARHLQGHGQEEDHAHRAHGHGLHRGHAQQAAVPRRR